MNIYDEIDREHADAVLHHGRAKSVHDAMGLLQEEMYELWEAVRTDEKEPIRKEAIQVAAMCVKLLEYLDG